MPPTTEPRRLHEHRQPEGVEVDLLALAHRGVVDLRHAVPAIRSLKTTLSIATAEASTPAPTYGTSSSSSKPWTVPSSPNGPCRTGNTASAPSRPPEGSASAGRPERPAPVAVDAHGDASWPPCRARRAPTAAEDSETSCSLERPPARTATLTASPGVGSRCPPASLGISRRGVSGVARRRSRPIAPLVAARSPLPGCCSITIPSCASVTCAALDRLPARPDAAASSPAPCRAGHVGHRHLADTGRRR